jgi:hypothetical protein
MAKNRTFARGLMVFCFDDDDDIYKNFFITQED